MVNRLTDYLIGKCVNGLKFYNQLIGAYAAYYVNLLFLISSVKKNACLYPSALRQNPSRQNQHWTLLLNDI